MAMKISWIILVIGVAGQRREPVVAEPPAHDGIRVIRDIAYREGASRQWKLDLATKNVVGGVPKPAIVVIHGGGWIEGDKSSFASRDAGVPGNIVDFAALGFVAVTINYRLAAEAPFPAALEDCKCAVRWLRAHAKVYDVDPHKIGAFGNSAGGHLAMLLGMIGPDGALEGDGPNQDQSSMVQAVVSDSGPIDLVEQYRQRIARGVQPVHGRPAAGSSRGRL